jgi:hypothetical protein
VQFGDVIVQVRRWDQRNHQSVRFTGRWHFESRENLPC